MFCREGTWDIAKNVLILNLLALIIVAFARDVYLEWYMQSMLSFMHV